MIVYAHSNPTDWLTVRLKELKKSLKGFYTHVNSATAREYLTAVESLDLAIKTSSTKTTKVDITVGSDNAIFLNYKDCVNSSSFEEYFNNCLNPDNSPIGFLEELNSLVAISYTREVTILTDGVYEVKQAKVLDDYLSLAPPF